LATCSVRESSSPLRYCWPGEHSSWFATDLLPPHYGIFQGEPADLRTPLGILAGALSLRGRGVIQLGLLILLPAPVARVAFSVFAFAMQRDLLYVIVTLVVLAVLVFSLAGGAL
jgi:hypothetical protein